MDEFDSIMDELDVINKLIQQEPLRPEDFEWGIRETDSEDEKECNTVTPRPPTPLTIYHTTVQIKKDRETRGINSEETDSSIYALPGSATVEHYGSLKTGDSKTPAVQGTPDRKVYHKSRWSDSYNNNREVDTDSLSDSTENKYMQSSQKRRKFTSTPQTDDNEISFPIESVTFYNNRWLSESKSKETINQTFPPYTSFSSSSPNECNSLNQSPFRTPNKPKRFVSQRIKQMYIHQPLPMYKDFQLLGDSQFVRFSEQLLNYKSCATFTEDTNSRQISYCVSGQKIRDLKQRLLEKEFKLADKVIVMIGTNDLTYGVPFNSMCKDYMQIIEFLKKSTRYILLLTVPPIPKLNNSMYWSKLKEYNKFIMDLQDGKNIFAIDVGSLYITYDNKSLEEYYEKVFGNTTRTDLVHLNKTGFALLRAKLDIYFSDNKFIN